MPGGIIIHPEKCIGCTTCALTCSLVHYGEFDLNKAHIRIIKHDFEGTFQISFFSTCRNCRRCARACPSGALQENARPAPPDENQTEKGEKQK